jgi:hypothetical protein
VDFNSLKETFAADSEHTKTTIGAESP